VVKRLKRNSIKNIYDIGWSATQLQRQFLAYSTTQYQHYYNSVFIQITDNSLEVAYRLPDTAAVKLNQILNQVFYFWITQLMLAESNDFDWIRAAHHNVVKHECHRHWVDEVA